MRHVRCSGTAWNPAADKVCVSASLFSRVIRVSLKIVDPSRLVSLPETRNSHFGGASSHASTLNQCASPIASFRGRTGA